MAFPVGFSACRGAAAADSCWHRAPRAVSTAASSLSPPLL